MNLTITILFFLFGIIVGSFLNVVIYRYNTKKSLGGRSACMSCQEKLCWYELLPLFSFLFLKGRCRSCKVKISRQYPAVEFTTGILFVSLFWKFQELLFANPMFFVTSFSFYALIFSILLIITVYDLKHKIIPDGLVWALAGLAFLGNFLFIDGYFSPGFPDLYTLSSGLWISVPFALLWLLSRGAWMGLGDAKLMLGIGWLLGPRLILPATIVSFWLGAILGILLIFVSKFGNKNYNLKTEIPFAPFLVLGSWVAFIFEISFLIF